MTKDCDILARFFDGLNLTIDKIPLARSMTFIGEIEEGVGDSFIAVSGLAAATYIYRHPSRKTSSFFPSKLSSKLSFRIYIIISVLTSLGTP